MIVISRAEFPVDFETVADLFLGYINFLFERTPEERKNIARKYDPAKIDSLVSQFAKIHARPKGDLLIARHGSNPVGCGMMRELEPGIAEIQRVFVTPQARGMGAGKTLTQALIKQAQEDGHHTIRLDTGLQLIEAQSLYEKLGFKRRPPYHQETPYLDHLIQYYELKL